ncbi:CBS domain-containing protein [Rubrobacter aplysinae]|uniref:CBS domain-containing protein n=1 Tax=Rubrobacter aplysinae TaxID=909625 RepID=UPI00069F53B4|nr:CBS domain-containing protein [Rubrobacter aplysinae]
MEEQDVRNIRVSEVMHEDWPTLSPDDTIETAIGLFAERRIPGAPVVEDGAVAGIVTEGDLILQDANIRTPGFLEILGGVVPFGDWGEYKEETIKSAGVAVGQVMTAETVSIPPEAALSEAATAMVRERKKILPVEDQGRLVGVVTRMDILKLHLKSPGS